MGFLSKIGSVIHDSARGIVNKTLSSLKDGVLQGIMKGLGSNAEILGLREGDSGYYYGDYIENLSMKGYCTFTDFYTTSEREQQKSNSLAYDRNRLRGMNVRYEQEEKFKSEKIADPEILNSVNWHQTLHAPNWGYDSFINERAIFQKGLTTPFGDPGYFYFKIFFKFETQFGLLGGILNNYDDTLGGHNTAMKYLSYLDGDGSGFYKSLLPAERMAALRKFVKSLSYINCNAPWFFKSIKGLDKAGNPVINEFSKERSIEIECNVDAIDMRLSTLLDLYRFVAYDDFTNKEILPENLRKFDITILIFNTPIKTLHTAIDNIKKLPYKQVSPHNSRYSHLMSYKLFEFNGCEISPDSIGSMIPGDVNNETPFNIGKGVLKINYDRCTVYTSNETNGILFGSTGFFYDYDSMGTTPQAKLAKQYEKFIENTLGIEKNSEQSRTQAFKDKYNYYSLFTDVAESYTKNNLAKLSGYSLGNLYGEDNVPTYPPDNTRVSGTVTPYFKSKIAHLHNRKNPILQLGGSLLANIFNSSMDVNASLGYLEGYKERGPGSEWWKHKIDKLTSNYKHIWTTTPHSHKYEIAGHEIGQRNYSKSYYVSNQEYEDSLASIDQANSLTSYALRDRLRQSMQDLKRRADRGEFVGPGSKAFSNKTTAMKKGSHTSTEVPHLHTGKSSEKYVQQLKENIVFDETNLLNKPNHEFTTVPYKKVNDQTNTLNKPKHEFTESPHMHTEKSSENYIQRLRENMVFGETNLLNKPNHEFTTAPHQNKAVEKNILID